MTMVHQRQNTATRTLGSKPNQTKPNHTKQDDTEQNLSNQTDASIRSITLQHAHLAQSDDASRLCKAVPQYGRNAN
jgi:hypothetical protein